MRRRGFTIVEVLVVTTMLTAVLAILLPSMGRTREIGRRVVCASHLHQTGVAHMTWSMDNKGKLVEGQPVYDRAADGESNLTQGDSGHYAIWFQDWKKPSRSAEYGGRYTKEGALVRKGYLTDAQHLYCPSWRVPWVQYGVSSKPFNQPGGGWFADESKVHADQTWMVSSYHYNSQFGPGNDYRGGTGTNPKWRGAQTDRDPNTAALASDAFSDPARGVDWHHVDGYNVLYLDTHVKFFLDKEKKIRDLKNGQTYISTRGNYRNYQAKAWRMFEGRE